MRYAHATRTAVSGQPSAKSSRLRVQLSITQIKLMLTCLIQKLFPLLTLCP
ncbi:MAG: hypothetical protein F6K56_02175 [Moorea sp. SIO3G5]|nr:hypothetical protein [Moorena sp. SIO3G5]